jgi:glyceraldehyde-3-phosphate dehydrogenase/erythrose-4-phosphate dehydrogenase
MRIGVALVGFGRWGENLARVLAGSPRFRLIAIVDVEPPLSGMMKCRAPDFASRLVWRGAD